MMMPFSLLISIYRKECAENFNQCMHSVWDKQTRKPNEIILVEDGVLTDELDEIINQWKKRLGDKLKVVALEKNVGLGEALNVGLAHCQHDLVARMDTDDIATAERFEKQLSFFKVNPDISVLGSWVGEFEHDEEKTERYKKVPENHTEIVQYAKKRNPMNHPSVMFRKSAVEHAGNYKTMQGFEDYYLWVRMLINGEKFHNIQEALVNMRVDEGQIDRRSGFNYAIHEFTFQKTLLAMGFIHYAAFFRNVSVRFLARIVPKKIVKFIYTLLRQ